MQNSSTFLEAMIWHARKEFMRQRLDHLKAGTFFLSDSSENDFQLWTDFDFFSYFSLHSPKLIPRDHKKVLSWHWLAPGKVSGNTLIGGKTKGHQWVGRDISLSLFKNSRNQEPRGKMRWLQMIYTLFIWNLFNPIVAGAISLNKKGVPCSLAERREAGMWAWTGGQGPGLAHACCFERPSSPLAPLLVEDPLQ